MLGCNSSPNAEHTLRQGKKFKGLLKTHGLEHRTGSGENLVQDWSRLIFTAEGDKIVNWSPSNLSGWVSAGLYLFWGLSRATEGEAWRVQRLAAGWGLTGLILQGSSLIRQIGFRQRNSSWVSDLQVSPVIRQSGFRQRKLSLSFSSQTGSS